MSYLEQQHSELFRNFSEVVKAINGDPELGVELCKVSVSNDHAGRLSAGLVRVPKTDETIVVVPNGQRRSRNCKVGVIVGAPSEDIDPEEFYNQVSEINLNGQVVAYNALPARIDQLTRDAQMYARVNPR